MKSYFLEVDYYQISKAGQIACGDAFYSQKQGERTILVMADGLGSGIKASVLSTLTSTMASAFIYAKMDIRRAAEVILETLPVCSMRKIGYSTFTIADVLTDGKVRLIEHDNPPCVLVRDGKILPIKKQSIHFEAVHDSVIYYSEFQLKPRDRLIVFSDGVTQSGMGRPGMLLGWQQSGTEAHIQQIMNENPEISASELCKRIAKKAEENDLGSAADDITASAIYLRKPRKTLLVTGPPYKREHDALMAEILKGFKGAKVICGGTTSEIISRELNRPVTVNLKDMRSSLEVPPTAHMQGVDLVTEGTITLSRALQLLEQNIHPETMEDNGISRLMNMLIGSDIIDFVVGTKINEAHQDPALPKDLEIRRSLIRRLAYVMESQYFKQTNIRFV